MSRSSVLKFGMGTPKAATMFFKFRDRLNRAVHAARCKGIWTTPPVASRPGQVPLVFLSQITSRDLLMYLVAIKSILTRVGFGQVVQLGDKVTEADRETLQRHLPGSVCIPVDKVDTDVCPRGGTWERLCHIIDLSRDSYVVQVDADTVVTGDIPEVIDCILTNRAFTLGTRQGRQFISLQEASAFARTHDARHIQIAAEQKLDNLRSASALRYVRGSSGFAGFARAGFTRERLHDFSQQMSALLGERWREWGTEQISSSFAVANSPSGLVLPYPKYACFDLEMHPDGASFLHFIGTNRFDRGMYAAASRDVIARLNPP